MVWAKVKIILTISLFLPVTERIKLEPFYEVEKEANFSEDGEVKKYMAVNRKEFAKLKTKDNKGVFIDEVPFYLLPKVFY